MTGSHPPTDPPPDPQGSVLDGLMERVRKGEVRAFEILIESHWRSTVLYAQALGAGDQAPDVAQEAFARLWERRDSWEPRGSVKAWLLRTARNLVIGQARREEVRLRLGDEPHPPRTPATPLQETERTELRLAIEQAIARLSPRRREVFTLFYLHDLSYQETAEIMNIRPQSVANYLQAGLEDLRQALSPFFADPVQDPQSSSAGQVPSRSASPIPLNRRGA